MPRLFRHLVLFVVVVTAGPGLLRGQTPTFNEDVGPVLHRHCASCHFPAGDAPFSLVTYEDAQRRARQIAEVTESGFMPPWLPSARSASFSDIRRLRVDEIDLLRNWAAADAPRGTGPPPVANLPTRGWQLGEPDLIVSMAEPFLIPADGPEIFRNFVIRVPAETRRWVRTAEIRFSTPGIVHHAILTVDAGDSSRRMDREDEGPGFDGMQAFSRAPSPSGHFVSWTPGKVPFPGYEDMAWELAAGADLVLETHLLPSGKPEVLQVAVGLFFAAEPPRRQPVILRLGSKTLDIPAGESGYTIEDSFVLPVALELLTIYPHAHYLGRFMKAEARLPDGRTIRLIEIPQWDFNWQDLYRFSSPLVLRAGTEIHMSYTYDNSAANPRNPYSPPRRVRYGPSSLDEMGDLWIQAVPGSVSDLVALNRALEVRERTALVGGYRKRLFDEPDDARAHFNLGSELVSLGSLEEGISELRRALDLEPEMSAAHLNLGNALKVVGRHDEALAHFEMAVELEPERAESLFNLANSMARAGAVEDALGLYDRTLVLRPRFAGALVNRGLALASLGRLEESHAALLRAREAEPGHPAALYNLALRSRQLGDLDLALSYVTEGLDAQPWDPRLLVASGDILFDLERFTAAAQRYERALQVAPSSAAAHAALGLTFVRLEKREEGLRELRKALEIEPANQLARAVLEDLAGVE